MSVGAQNLVDFRLDLMNEFHKLVLRQAGVLDKASNESFAAGMISGLESAGPLLRIAFSKAVELKNEREE